MSTMWNDRFTADGDTGMRSVAEIKASAAAQLAATAGSSLSTGSTVIDSTAYMQRADEIKNDYASSLAEINSQFLTLNNTIAEINVGIDSALAENKAIGDESYAKLDFDLRQQLTNINNSQNIQITRAASQLDSLAGSGAFGGNVYRAQQVYSQNVTSVIAAAMKNTADVTLSYRAAAEDLKYKYAAGQLTAYLSGANMILSASVDVAKAQAGLYVDMLKSKTSAINDMYALKQDVDKVNAQIKSAENIAQAQINAEWAINEARIASANRNASIAASTSRYVTDVNAAADKYRVDASTQIAENKIQYDKDVRINDQNNQLEQDRLLAQAKAYKESNTNSFVQSGMDAAFPDGHWMSEYTASSTNVSPTWKAGTSYSLPSTYGNYQAPSYYISN